jgi:hypothetical protein
MKHPWEVVSDKFKLNIKALRLILTHNYNGRSRIWTT